jgi:hypothetical protein
MQEAVRERRQSRFFYLHEPPGSREQQVHVGRTVREYFSPPFPYYVHVAEKQSKKIHLFLHINSTCSVLFQVLSGQRVHHPRRACVAAARQR